MTEKERRLIFMIGSGAVGLIAGYATRKTFK